MAGLFSWNAFPIHWQEEAPGLGPSLDLYSLLHGEAGYLLSTIDNNVDSAKIEQKNPIRKKN